MKETVISPDVAYTHIHWGHKGETTTHVQWGTVLLMIKMQLNNIIWMKGLLQV